MTSKALPVKSLNASRALHILSVVVKTLRLALPKLGVGWMFALLTIDFNRIAVVELRITAVLITALLSVHYFLSPFQVISGRFADQHPIGGLRRTPYLLIAAVLGGLIFLLLPSVVHDMGAGSPLAYVEAVILFALFGITIAVMGDSHHSLIAEVTEPRSRGAVVAVVWTFTILSTIFSAVVMNAVRPTYTPELMQRLYSLTPFIVIGSTLLGIVGMEKRLTPAQVVESVAKAKAAAPAGNPLSVTIKVLRTNRQAAMFFTFVFLAILAIFLQDNILEVFGAEVFGMTVKETTRFQPTWGGGVLMGMLLMGILSFTFAIPKRNIAVIGCAGTALGFVLLTMAAFTQQRALITPALTVMGFFTGFFNIGALSMMMDMTVEGATGLYMGLWGMAQAFGNGTASLGAGALHTALIESGAVAPNVAYSTIFGAEALLMIGAALLMWRLSVTKFQEQAKSSVTKADALRALEVSANG
jgi:BCD family chlorophyll transporter-like MFS transporter